MTFAAGKVLNPKDGRVWGYFASQSIGSAAVYKICDNSADAVASGLVFPKRYICSCDDPNEELALLYVYYSLRQRACVWRAQICRSCSVILRNNSTAVMLPNISSINELVASNLRKGTRIHFRVAGREATEFAIYLDGSYSGVKVRFEETGKILTFKWQKIVEFWPLPPH